MPTGAGRHEWRTRRPRRSSSLCTDTEDAQEERPPARPDRRQSRPTTSALSVCIGCASRVAYTRVSELSMLWPMFLCARAPSALHRL